MPYEHRFGNCCGRNDCKHDPATNGIFIHGGTCTAGPFFDKTGANRFGITLPCSNKKGEEIDTIALYNADFTKVRMPTFQKAVETARKLREEVPGLKDCRIYACTDMQMDTRSSGRTAIQRVA